MDALDPAAIDRFRRDLDSFAGADSGIGIAVSGGADSLALLLLAAAARPCAVEAATVDHGLRPEGKDEARAVADICRTLDIRHEILEIAVADGKAGIQAEARAARYAALADWCRRRGLAYLLTGHHADDQAETLLMRLQRGAGLPGLSGIRPRRTIGPDLMVARPLLGWRRAELAGIVRGAGLEPADDPSNRDARYDRSRVRAWLAERPELEPMRLARSAAALREADEALEAMAQGLFARRADLADGRGTLDVAGLPRELRRRLLILALDRLDPDWRPGRDVESLLQALEAGETATFGGIRAEGGVRWQFAPAPPRRRR